MPEMQYEGKQGIFISIAMSFNQVRERNIYSAFKQRKVYSDGRGIKKGIEKYYSMQKDPEKFCLPSNRSLEYIEMVGIGAWGGRLENYSSMQSDLEKFCFCSNRSLK